jgi:ABC-2 type transport system permease protein
MNGTVARLTASTLFSRRRALLILALPVVLLILAVAFRLLVGRNDTTASLLGAFSLGTVIPLLALIAGTGAIGPEIDDGSIIYLLAKPQSRHTIVRTKLAIAAALGVGIGGLPVLAAAWITSGRADSLVYAYGAGAAVAAVAYSALFVLLAVLTRNAVVIGLLYALGWESLVGNLVPGAQALSVQQWSLALTERVAGTRAGDVGIDAAVGLPVGATSLVVLTVAATWFAGHRLRSLRLAGDD